MVGNKQVPVTPVHSPYAYNTLPYYPLVHTAILSCPSYNKICKTGRKNWERLTLPGCTAASHSSRQEGSSSLVQCCCLSQHRRNKSTVAQLPLALAMAWQALPTVKLPLFAAPDATLTHQCH